MPGGLSELIVHLRAPGPVEPIEAHLADLTVRGAEWATLTDPRVAALLARHGVAIVDPPDHAPRQLRAHL